MALFGRKKEMAPLTPENGRVRLPYSRTMPEHLESIAAPEALWQQLSELGDQYHITGWAGYNECRLRTPRTKRWLLYITFANGETLRAEGCGAAPKGHEEWEDRLLALLNSQIDV